MADLILYLAVTAVGYIIGSKIRDRKDSLGWTGKVQTVALTCLIICMGMRMGSNEEIISNLSTIGVSAVVITVVVMVFSIAGIFITRKIMGIDKYGRFRTEEEKAAGSSAQTDAQETDGKSGVNTMTLVIIGAVIAGMLIGYFVIRNIFAGNMDTFNNLAGWGIKIGLCILLVFVGLDLGLDGTVIDNFRKVGLRIFAFPAVVAVATLLGAGISGMLMGFSLKESLAIGAGYGWYSLAPGIIMDAGYMTASAVSFLHNVMRELFAILFIPFVASKVGYIETTGMPGAAAMDVCLPIVEKSTRSDIAVYSFVSGVILSALVPVMVPLIIG
ncbi:MAG: lysine exporter LysO family protein [Firmicutes bacterium]|nr:lysine exporter LysO family protein [Bacillota bacterium]